MGVRRTILVKLTMTERDADLLHETIQQFQWAANYVIHNARNDDGYVEMSKGKLNSRTYDDFGSLPNLITGTGSTKSAALCTNSVGRGTPTGTCKRPVERRQAGSSCCTARRTNPSLKLTNVVVHISLRGFDGHPRSDARGEAASHISVPTPL